MTQTASFRAFLRALADGATLQAAASSALATRPRRRVERTPELLERVRALGLGDVTTTRAVLEELGLAGRAEEMRVAAALGALGYVRRRMPGRAGGGRGYVYRRDGAC